MATTVNSVGGTTAAATNDTYTRDPTRDWTGRAGVGEGRCAKNGLALESLWDLLSFFGKRAAEAVMIGPVAT